MSSDLKALLLLDLDTQPFLDAVVARKGETQALDLVEEQEQGPDALRLGLLVGNVIAAACYGARGEKRANLRPVTHKLKG